MAVFPQQAKVTTSPTTSILTHTIAFVMLLQHRRNGNNINQKMILYLDVVRVQHHPKFPPPWLFSSSRPKNFELFTLAETWSFEPTRCH